MQKFIIHILLMLLPASLVCQNSPDSTNAFESINFMNIGIGYTSNSNNSRNANAIRMPGLMGNISYYSKSGLWTSANLLKYSGASIPSYDTEVQLGYQKTFKNNLDVDIYYTNHQFKGDEAYEGVPYDHSLTLTGEYRFNNLAIGLDNEYMIGSNDNYFLDLNISYEINIDGILGETDYLSLSPSIISSFGTTYWVPYTMEHVWGEYMSKDHMGDNHMNQYVPENQFEYQRISFILPIIYSTGIFSVSGGWYYSIPSKNLKEQKWGNQSGVLLSLIYSIIFER